MASPVPPEEDAALSFRPMKRRKLYRKRNDTSDSETAPPLDTSTTSPPAQSLDELILSASNTICEPPSTIPLASLMRQRKALQRKRHGIEFSAAKQSEAGTRGGELQENGKEEGEESRQLEDVGMRFAPQTGQVADVNKHMMAYIDTELAKRLHLAPTQHSISSNAQDINIEHTDHSIHRQPAALGKLHEIDLGPDARARNVAATEAAQRRLAGEEEDDDGKGEAAENRGQSGKKQRVRLGSDGKPMRERKKKRRGSEDVRRDQIVEEVLRESRLDLYPVPVAPGLAELGQDEGADERLAEQFRQEFLDAMASRRQATKPAKPKPGEKEEEKLKGPKLGGSRSQRAVMRERELEAQREREKKGRR